MATYIQDIKGLPVVAKKAWSPVCLQGSFFCFIDMIKNGNGFRVVDLFSGAGGFTIGFAKADYNILLSTDFDIDCSCAHRHNMPSIPFLQSDIKDITENTLKEFSVENVDLLIGGPPCQGFSTIGARASSKEEVRNRLDPRNKLFKEYIRILSLIKPTFFLMENVRGILTKDKGKVLSDIKEAFLNAGYTLNITVLNAADYGVPQIRERVFFYGNKLGIEMAPPTPTHGEGRVPNTTVLQAIGDLAYDNVAVSNHVPLKHGEINIRRYALIPEGGRMPEDKLPPELYRKNFGNTFKRLDRNKPSLTMVPGHNAFPIHPWLNRSLTVREAARIQTFPDDYIFMGSRQKQCMQVGNAVPCLLSYVWAEHLKKYIQRTHE